MFRAGRSGSGCRAMRPTGPDESGVELISTAVDVQSGRSATRRLTLPLRQGTLSNYIVKPGNDQFHFNTTFTDVVAGNVDGAGRAAFPRAIRNCSRRASFGSADAGRRAHQHRLSLMAPYFYADPPPRPSIRAICGSPMRSTTSFSPAFPRLAPIRFQARLLPPWAGLLPAVARAKSTRSHFHHRRPQHSGLQART